MSTISLCMIVKDEEKVIERCLNTVVDIVDEIIIVDTGSQDSTKEKVKRYKEILSNFFIPFCWCKLNISRYLLENINNF